MNIKQKRNSLAEFTNLMPGTNSEKHHKRCASQLTVGSFTDVTQITAIAITVSVTGCHGLFSQMTEHLRIPDE
jgi:hypothetical protein